MNVAFEGQFNVLSAINKSDNVKRFIYASSSEVYQQPTIIPTPEEVPLIVPDINNNPFPMVVEKLLVSSLLNII